VSPGVGTDILKFDSLEYDVDITKEEAISSPLLLTSWFESYLLMILFSIHQRRLSFVYAPVSHVQ